MFQVSGFSLSSLFLSPLSADFSVFAVVARGDATHLRADAFVINVTRIWEVDGVDADVLLQCALQVADQAEGFIQFHGAAETGFARAGVVFIVISEIATVGDEEDHVGLHIEGGFNDRK